MTCIKVEAEDGLFVAEGFIVTHNTLCELEFALQGGEATNGCSLILTTLAVAPQIEGEGWKYGYAPRVVRDASEVRAGINICNYDRLEKLDPSRFGCVALDESGIIKNFMGKTTGALISAFADTPFRLCATATPAPNDHVELGTHAEFLGIMPRADMLLRWFVNDASDTGTWRLKGHAIEPFWDWVSSWAVMASSPEDMGFDGSCFLRWKSIGTGPSAMRVRPLGCCSLATSQPRLCTISSGRPPPLARMPSHRLCMRSRTSRG
jgi:hypothetical protein